MIGLVRTLILQGRSLVSRRHASGGEVHPVPRQDEPDFLSAFDVEPEPEPDFGRASFAVTSAGVVRIVDPEGLDARNALRGSEDVFRRSVFGGVRQVRLVALRRRY